MPNAYQTSAFAYQGRGKFAYQEQASAPAATATPGRIGRVYPPEYFNPRRGRIEETAEPPRRDRSAEYAEKSAKITAAIARLRRDTEEYSAAAARLRAEIAALQGQNRARALAEAEHALMLKEQALTLARAQETALLEELEVIDIAYFALVGLGDLEVVNIAYLALVVGVLQ